MNDFEELSHLYERLDAYRNYRSRLLWLTLFYFMGVILAAASMRLLRGGLVAFFIGVIVIGAVIGLTLLNQYIRNEVRGRELEKDVREVKLRHQVGGKAKNEDLADEVFDDDEEAYVIGEDGELIPLETEEDSWRASR
jgi:hypothetical protein